MGLVELVTLLGDDKIMLQSVDNSLVKAVYKPKTKDTELTIATTQVSVADATKCSGKVGVILWVERSDFNNAMQGKQDKPQQG